MAKIKHAEFNTEIQIQGVEILNSSLRLPVGQNTPLTNFNFNIRIESQVNSTNKLVFVITHIEIKNGDQSIALGALSVSCIFKIINFEEVVTVEPDGKINLPKPLIEILNSISISTTRGVMFSTFKGTFLHGAILPIFDPKQFQTESPISTKKDTARKTSKGQK